MLTPSQPNALARLPSASQNATLNDARPVLSFVRMRAGDLFKIGSPFVFRVPQAMRTSRAGPIIVMIVVDADHGLEALAVAPEEARAVSKNSPT